MIIYSNFDYRKNQEPKGSLKMSYVDLKNKTILVTGAAGL